MKKIIFLLIVVPFMALAQSCSKNNDMQPNVHVSAGVSVGNGGYNNNGVIYPNDQLVWFNNQQVPMSTLVLARKKFIGQLWSLAQTFSMVPHVLLI